MSDNAEVGTPTTYFDLLSLVVYHVFYCRPNTIVIDIIFAFGLVWEKVRRRRNGAGVRTKVFDVVGPGSLWYTIKYRINFPR